MITKVALSHEPARRQPWLVRWWGPPDPESGKQKRFSRSFRYRRDAQAFQGQKQAEVDSGSHLPECLVVTLSQLLDRFREARLARLSHSSKVCYANTFEQLREYFGDDKKVRDIQQLHAEAFISSRRRRDGRPGDLSTWSIAQHLKHCRGLFGAALEWGYIHRNPFRPVSSRSRSSLQVRGKSRPWHHLKPSEFHRLLESTPCVRRRALYWLMYGAGLRPGEAVIKLSGPFTLTSFRKSFAQNHADAGTPPKTLASLLGHSDVRITMQFYNRVTDANRAAAAAAIDNLFAGHFHSTATGAESEEAGCPRWVNVSPCQM